LVLQLLTLRQPDKLDLLTDFTPLILTLEDIDVLTGGQVVSEALGNKLEILRLQTLASRNGSASIKSKTVRMLLVNRQQ